METKERKELYQKALKLWRIKNIVFMVMEESGEMLNALAKYNRYRSTPKEVITELADVWILMEQMAELFGWDEFQKELQYKLERLKQRLDDNESLIEEKGKTATET